MNRSREIIEIFADVVASVAKDCTVKVYSLKGEFLETSCPEVNYVFGSSQYVKDRLDELSKSAKGNEIKFPLIALFCPFVEERNSPRYYSRATVNLLIACSSRQQWSNEQRRVYSFENILRPIYRRFLEELEQDGRFDFGYDNTIKHRYSENYSFGKYGAVTSNGEAVSEPIDAINITNLELITTNKNCR